MNCSRKLALLLGALFLLSACATRGPVFEPAPAPSQGKALVYVYRLSAFFASARDALVFLDDKNIVDIGVSNYSYFYVDAGAHTVKQRWPFIIPGNTLELPLSAAPNATYYVKLYFGSIADCPPSTTCSEFKMELAPESAALTEIKEFRFRTPN